MSNATTVAEARLKSMRLALLSPTGVSEVRVGPATAPKPKPPKPTPPTPDPAALAAVRQATGVDRSRLHESAHGLLGELMDVTVGAIVVFGAHGGGQTRHEPCDPHRTAVLALASVVIGELGGWHDTVGPRSDIEDARTAARQIDPDDPKAVYERLKAEAHQLVSGHLAAIVRLAEVLEDFSDRLAGWQVEDALAYALQKPSPRPRPGPRGRVAADVLFKFMTDRMNWRIYLQQQMDDPTDAEAYRQVLSEADRRALAQEPPPQHRKAASPAETTEPIPRPDGAAIDAVPSSGNGGSLVAATTETSETTT